MSLSDKIQKDKYNRKEGPFFKNKKVILWEYEVEGLYILSINCNPEVLYLSSLKPH